MYGRSAGEREVKEGKVWGNDLEALIICLGTCERMQEKGKG